MAASIADLAVGVVFVACGAIAFRRVRPTGLLLAATGAAWLLGSAVGALVFLHRGPLVHLLLSYPGGRLGSRFDRLVVAAAYVTAVVYPLGSSEAVTLALLAAVVGAAAARHLRAGGALRRPTAAALAAALAVATVLAAGALGRIADAGGSDALLWAYELALGAVAIGLCVGLVRGRWTAAAITDLVVDLGELERETSLRARLARSVGDPSLELGYWQPARGRYLDEAGHPLALPGPGAAERVLRVDEAGAPLAVIVHDPAVLGEPGLAEAVTRAVRIAVANVRLQEDVRGRVRELRESRRRLVEAAAAERERLEAELWVEAGPRLQRVGSLLEGEHPVLEPLAAELDASREELLELARGIHPRVLTESGLAAALAELAGRSALPVQLDVDVGELPPATAAAAYFVCSEGLANAVKHAHASGVRIGATGDGGALRVEVSDDGAGGADSAGSGLVGLADRVEALGGTLRLESPIGGGTTLAAELGAGR